MAGVHASAKSYEVASERPKAPSGTQQSLNQRRSPPRDIKLLPGHKRQKLSHSPEFRSASVPVIPKTASQESSSDQSANGWFNKVNEHVGQRAQGPAGYDDEPPFFITRQQNYLPTSVAPSENSKMFGANFRLDSENEELRSVIDDLTVENKRLKQIVRSNHRSQRNSPSTDGKDKLFEVRMHGLSSEKRRELEFLLKNFATSVHTSVPSIPNSTAGSGISSTSHGNNQAGKAKTDSGYASNSNSGHPSTHVSRGMSSVSKPNMDKTINKYLHDIPDTLMPRQQPVVMSENARMALVVRRLEQLFTGRMAAPGEHSQPLQQQEVSQMAARADANASRKRKAEGTREAHILPPDTKVNLDTMESDQERKKVPALKHSESDSSAAEEMGHVASRPGSPDQRPTRPLDLDIHRAQVAAENIQYIRHLGLSSPHIHSNSSDESWMYLNLLINMAQLHTINVTPEFVRRSVRKLSTKFELSKDGHRVRWIGGPEGTIFSKEYEKALEVADNNKDNNSLDDSNEESGTSGSSKRSKTDSNSNAMVSNTTSEDKTSGMRTSSGSKQQISSNATSHQQISLQTQVTKDGSAFDYKPIVYRGGMQDLAEEPYLQDSDSSPADSSRDSSGLVHALSRSNLREKRSSDEGAITFYNNPFFCSDYSGDKKPTNMLSTRDIAPNLVIGNHVEDYCGETSRLAEACYFTPQFGPTPFRQAEDEQLPQLQVAPLTIVKKEETQPIEFTFAGLGGVTPEDNFVIDVDVHMARVSPKSRAEPLGRVPYTGTTIKSVYIYKQRAQEKIDLLPSRLPPPSYIFFTSSSSSGGQINDDDDDEDDDDDTLDESDETSSSADEENPAPPSFLQHWSAEDSGDMEADDDDDDDDDDDLDDSSMDMLAVARAADPIQIAEQERQYMINQPAGRAVAGSLAATVGASRSTPSIDVASDQPEVDSDSEDGYDMDLEDD